MPTAFAEGRIIRFLSQVYDSSKGILGVDLGASAATVAAAFSGELTLGVYPQLGLGEGLANLLRYTSLEEILKWIPLDIPAEAVQSYLYQKSIYPTSLPATPEDLAIEQALARQTLSVALNSIAKDFPRRVRHASPGLIPYFEPILAGGSVITRAPALGQSLLILLDAIQPVGITTMILDQNNLLPALGAAASRNSILPVQVLESGAFLGLATVVAPYVNAQLGTPVLHGRLVYQNGNESRLDIKLGALEVLPLPVGQSGRSVPPAVTSRRRGLWPRTHSRERDPGHWDGAGRGDRCAWPPAALPGRCWTAARTYQEMALDGRRLGLDVGSRCTHPPIDYHPARTPIAPAGTYYSFTWIRRSIRWMWWPRPISGRSTCWLTWHAHSGSGLMRPRI